MRKACTITLTLVTLVASSGAQIPHGGNAFVGYSYAQGQVPTVIGPHSIGMNGWEASAEGRFLPWLGGVADFDWHYGGMPTPCAGTGCTAPHTRTTGSRHTLLFGPRASLAAGRYTPFAQALVGLAHQTSAVGTLSRSDLAFANSLGGGLDYRLLNSIALRAQLDWMHTSLFGTGRSSIRVSTGIAFRF